MPFSHLKIYGKIKRYKEATHMKIYDYIDEKVLKEIVNVLDDDGLIIFPTDTVYGIACKSFSDKAIQKLFRVKSRGFDNPINVLTDSISKINLVVNGINDIERELIQRYFPGQLTIIFDKKPGISNLLTANKPTIGVRIPNYKMALQILAACPYPLATTSANISGEETYTEIDDIVDAFQDKVDIIIDGGKAKSIPSTIVRVDHDKIRILRKGSLKLCYNDIVVKLNKG